MFILHSLFLCLGGPIDQNGVLHDLCVFANTLSSSWNIVGGYYQTKNLSVCQGGFQNPISL